MENKTFGVKEGIHLKKKCLWGIKYKKVIKYKYLLFIQLLKNAYKNS